MRFYSGVALKWAKRFQTFSRVSTNIDQRRAISRKQSRATLHMTRQSNCDRSAPNMRVNTGPVHATCRLPCETRYVLYSSGGGGTTGHHAPTGDPQRGGSTGRARRATAYTTLTQSGVILLRKVQGTGRKTKAPPPGQIFGWRYDIGVKMCCRDNPVPRARVRSRRVPEKAAILDKPRTRAVAIGTLQCADRCGCLDTADCSLRRDPAPAERTALAGCVARRAVTLDAASLRLSGDRDYH